MNRAILLFFLLCTTTLAQQPGSQSKGVVLLPNGWKIAPAGHHIQLDDLPMEMIESSDGRYMIVTNNGYSKPILSIVDLEHLYVRDRVSVENAWLGLAWTPDGKKVYSSGGGKGTIDILSFNKGSLKLETSWQLTHTEKTSFIAGISVSPDGSRLYAVQVLGNLLSVIDATSGKEIKTIPLEAEPYSTLLTPDGKTLFVSIWGKAEVLEIDADSLQTRNTLAVGEHPNSMALSPDGTRLYVACANTNSIWVLDLVQQKSIEQISVSLYPHAPVGSTPTGLGLSQDGKTLLVANSDNNCVAMVDVSQAGKSQVKGFIPTGWYPTAAHFSHNQKRIYVLSGKGLTSVPNPRGADEPNYIAQMLLGTLSVVSVPDEKELAAYTKTVYQLTPYSDSIRLSPLDVPQHSAIPNRVGEASPIKHVFYIIRENRTYDQVFGDMPQGNGDPNLCLFCEDVTPNAHALARQFVLLDNFYVDAEVSADGHAFSMGGYANDFIEKTWPMNYADRGAKFLTMGGGAVRNPYGNIAAPPQGYIWDAAKRKGISVRSYGEFGNRGEVEDEDSGKGEVEAAVPGLKGSMHPQFPPYDLRIPDNKRVDIWLEEFRQYEKDGNLPQLSILALPDDHTASTRPGYPVPRAMVAENDLAMGRVVEAISQSRYWKDSAIFILEDDAQDGPDHVDAHRSVGLIISPYTQSGAVDSTLYTTCGFLRTIELILGLEPLSQYDAAATPTFRSFVDKPLLKPFQHLEPRISLDEKNTAESYGAQDSIAMNLDEPDRAPMREMNEILWKSIKGKDSIMPPPVHAAFVRPMEED
ncbi:MAG: hypothetical protein C5B54_03920 [Acidobacteria bacterium]|nr:MAG: hypothetical protein C5B54_03920 [Acidobacteriota bacterium]